MLIKTDSTGRILHICHPDVLRLADYVDYIEVDVVPFGMTHYSNGEFFVGPKTQEEVVGLALAQRARLLVSSDWTQLPDVPLATKEAWATYRQALRDITDQPGYPLTIVWPIPPGASS